MDIRCTPDQVHDWVSALGAADSCLRDLASHPEQLVGGEKVPKIFRDLMRDQATALRSLQAELTRAYNEDRS